MNWLSFIFGMFCLISFDVISGFLIYILLKKGNEFSNNFWSDQ